jgi:predicted outer membrane repeat protein
MLSNSKDSMIADRPSVPSAAARLHRVRRRILTTLAVMTLGVLATAGAASANYTVNDTRDLPQKAGSAGTCVTNEGTCTLRAAIQAADDTEEGQTITLPAGEYKLTIPSTSSNDPATGDLDVKGGATDITIDGAGSSDTVINANHIDRAFAVHEGDTLTIDGVTVENGAQNGEAPSEESTAANKGGAFYNDGTLTIEDSVLKGNSAGGKGGVIYSAAQANSTNIDNSTVTRNASEGEGGVLSVASGSVELIEDTITHNSADSYGGVLYADEAGNTKANIKIESSELLKNVSDSDGGALYVEDTGKLEVASTTFSHNSNDDDDGGAIYADETEGFSVNASHFLGNTSGDSEGGAIYADNAGPMTVNGGSTFENDTAGDSDGGAIYADDTALTVEESSFRNDVGDEGGALYLDGSSSTTPYVIKVSTFIDNSAIGSEGGAIYDSEGALAVESSTLASNNASDEGGALYYDSGGALLLVNDTLDGNQAGLEGGAIDLAKSASEGEIVLVNDTVAHNTAYEGGGIYKPECRRDPEHDRRGQRRRRYRRRRRRLLRHQKGRQCRRSRHGRQHRQRRQLLQQLDRRRPNGCGPQARRTRQQRRRVWSDPTRNRRPAPGQPGDPCRRRNSGGLSSCRRARGGPHGRLRLRRLPGGARRRVADGHGSFKGQEHR